VAQGGGRADAAAVIAAARRYLLEQADGGFREACHTMRFPRAAGFAGELETHVAEVFPRAVLAGVLLDAAEIGDDATFRARVREIARREADHAAARRLGHRAGGWSYFPGLAELPPDLDSLSAVLLLFARAAPDDLPLCDGPVDLALGQAGEEGAIPTWLVSPHDDPRDRARMEEGIRRFWGHGADVDVLAHFYFALWTRDPVRHADAVRRGARYLESRQAADGAWAATWYHGQAYAAALCVRMLGAVREGGGAVARAAGHLMRAQRPDGGWGASHADPQETALALFTLGLAGEVLPAAARERALERLIEAQRPEGRWDASPWIRMDAGRARGGGGPILSFGSATLTTAFVLRTLVRAAQDAD
jgi:squalene-hopene/tetraprenyl-beta-curcumene cyclase